MPPTNSTIDSISITEEEIYNTLISLDSTKATGIDGISPAVLKYCALPLTKPLHYLFSYAIYYCYTFLQNGKSIALSQFSKLAIKIVLPTTDPYLYFALHPRYSNILFMKKSLVLFLVTSPLGSLDSQRDGLPYNNF